jgi:hypothetical protein
MHDLEIENALLRRYIVAQNASRLNAGVVVVTDEMIERTGRAAIEGMFGQTLS